MTNEIICNVLRQIARLWKQIDEATIANDSHYSDMRTARIIAIMLERFITYNADVDNDEEYGYICALSDELTSFITYVETLKQ